MLAGTVGHCPVAPDSLRGVERRQTNASRWKSDAWMAFAEEVRAGGVELIEARATRAVFATDAGGTAYGFPHGVVIARSPEQVATLLRAAQHHEVPVTVRGGGLTTEGESVAFGGVLLDMTGMNRVLHVDTDAMTVRTQAGIFWHQLAEALRRHGLDYLSAPLNLTSSVGGTIGVGGVDVNSSRFGCSADQVVAMRVVTPTGEIVECSDELNAELFERVILGYGQFGVIVEATLLVRRYAPLRMQQFYYASLRAAVTDLQRIDQAQVADYSGILTIMDDVVTLLVAFDSAARASEFRATFQRRLHGRGAVAFALLLGVGYVVRPWTWRRAWYVCRRALELLPQFSKPEYTRGGTIDDRTVVFSRAVWRSWGSGQMVIPDLATSADKFVEAVERGNAVCRRFFPYYTLYCVGIKLRPEHRPHYEMSCIPPDAEGWAYGCEFEPMMDRHAYSRDYLQSFKNAIYDIGVDIGGSYYRFGGMMKGYIRRLFGHAVVDRHLAMKRTADPAMILNRDVIF